MPACDEHLDLETVEIKAFVPARDFRLSKAFYQDIGFQLKSDSDGIAYFSVGNSSFLLQDFYEPTHSSNFMMHLLVRDAVSWYRKLKESGVVAKYGVKMTDVQKQPWNMLDFCLYDPSRVLWRIGQNI